MSETLKPAHEVILGEIQLHNQTLAMVGEQIPAWMRGQEIGGLCSLLRVLEKMILPEEKLGEIIDRLRELPYKHAVTDTTIEVLSKRKSTDTT
jgi:hypothetical protein